MSGIAVIRSTLNAKAAGLPLGDVLLGSIKELRRGFIFEVFDTQSKSVVMTKSLVLNPRRYTLTEPFTSTLTPTEDNTVVAEENGVLIREIVLEGTTGLERRGEEALGRGTAAVTRASGTDHFYQLRRLFREYAKLKQDPTRGPNIQMHFHNAKEDDHFVVVPRSFETPRDAASNRMHMNYRINLAAIQELPGPKAPGETILEAITGGDSVKKLASALNDARSYIVESIDVLDVMRRRIVDPMIMLDGACHVANGVHNFIDGVTNTIDLPREYVSAVADFLEEGQELLENDIDREPTEAEFGAARRTAALRSSYEKVLSEPAQFGEPIGKEVGKAYAGAKRLTNDDLQKNTGGAEKGTRTRLALGSERDAKLDLGAFTGSKRVRTSASDTIDTIAQAAGVPREAIIEINKLKYPYITRGGGPGTLAPGDDILVPTQGSTSQAGESPTGDYLSVTDIVYGVDIALDSALAEEGIFEILVDEIHGSMDVQLVRGEANVVQGVQILLGTERGTTIYIPDLGIRRTPGMKGTVNNMLLASLYLREALLSDPRIVGIDSSRIVLEGDVLTQEITPQLSDARSGVTISVPFGKAAR